MLMHVGEKDFLEKVLLHPIYTNFRSVSDAFS